MNLNSLLASSGFSPALSDPEISSLAYDSRQVLPGALFFGLPGQKTNGAAHLAQASEKGAAAAVLEAVPESAACPVVVVQDARAAMADLSAAFHGHPSRGLKCVGVTGTNGKTTTAFLLKHILDSASLHCGLIGTVKYLLGAEEMDAPRTTPESPDLQSMLASMKETGLKAVAMEVSSHALAQQRARAIAFDAAVFTNLTQDHLDYHPTMEDYFAAKARLFEQVAGQTEKKGRAVINADDRYGHLLRERFCKQVKSVTFGQRVGADFRASAIRFDFAGSTFQLEARGKFFLVRMPLIGLFNVYNALGALAAAAACGVQLRGAIASLASAPQVPGRLERVQAKRNFQVFVDYAHTDDALRNVLKTLRDLEPERVITVFGCGGDRDRAKRPLMAMAAEEFSDWTVITSDNPRSEDPAAILRDVAAGMRGTNYEVVEDREKAIARAVALAGPGDVVLVAGKGHEKYQEFDGRKLPFDDVATAEKAILDKKGEI